MAAIQPSVEFWRELFENAYPDGTFAKYFNRSPYFLAKKFGNNAKEMRDIAPTFAHIHRADNILSQGKANWIMANQNLFATRLKAAISSQGQMNLLVLNCPELDIGGNVAVAGLLEAMNAEADPGPADPMGAADPAFGPPPRRPRI
jgi:hypothetical protein